MCFQFSKKINDELSLRYFMVHIVRMFEFGWVENSGIPNILSYKLVYIFEELSLLTLRGFGFGGIVE